MSDHYYIQCRNAAAAQLEQWLDSDDEALRQATVMRLHFAPTGELADIWRRKLTDGSRYGQETAAALMAQPQHPFQAYLPEIKANLTRLLHEGNDTVRSCALAALGHLFGNGHLTENDFSGSLQTDILAAAHGSPPLQNALCQSAWRFPAHDEIKQFLIRQLDKPDTAQASWALFSLDNHEPRYEATAITPLLLRLLDRTPVHDPFRSDIAASLIRRGETAVIPELKRLLCQQEIDSEICLALEDSTQPEFAECRTILAARFE